MPREEIRSGRSTGRTGSDFFNALQEMNRDWVEHANAEVELGLKLSKKLTAVHSVPDAVAAYQEWLSDEMNARAEDARRLMSNGQKIIDASSRLLSGSWTNVRFWIKRTCRRRGAMSAHDPKRTFKLIAVRSFRYSRTSLPRRRLHQPPFQPSVVRSFQSSYRRDRRPLQPPRGHLELEDVS
jgi:hypothetical protein